MAIDRRATRLGVLGLVALILFSLIGVRLWFLQTVKAEELQRLSTFASTRTVQIPPGVRGLWRPRIRRECLRQTVAQNGG